jgi:hypothetical protein
VHQILSLGVMTCIPSWGQDIQPEHWVWQSGQLVLMPSSIDSPIADEAVSAAANLNIQWNAKGEMRVAEKNNPDLDDLEFDPYLSHTPTTKLKSTLKHRPKRPEVIVPLIEKPAFRKGDLPEPPTRNPAKTENSAEELELKNVRSDSPSYSPQSPKDIQSMGEQLQKRSSELKKRFEQLKKDKHPNSAEVRNYLLDATALKKDLEHYRELASP